MTSSPDLIRFREELHDVKRTAGELLDGLSQEQLGWKPSPEAWSAGQVAAHLRTTNEQYASRVRESIERAARGTSDAGAPHRPTLVGGFLFRALNAPRKLPAPKIFRPSTESREDWRKEVEGYHAVTDQLDGLLADAEGVSLNHARVVSPVSRFVRMNLGDAIAIWLTHDRRHMGQIRRLREHPSFPQ